MGGVKRPRARDVLTEAEAELLHAIKEARSVVLSGRRMLGAGEWLPHETSTALSLVGRGLVVFVEPKRMMAADDAARDGWARQ